MLGDGAANEVSAGDPELFVPLLHLDRERVADLDGFWRGAFAAANRLRFEQGVSALPMCARTTGKKRWYSAADPVTAGAEMG